MQVRGNTQIVAGSITNAEISAAAAIAWTKLSKTGSSLADLATRSAADLSSGTLADARFPAILPAISGANLTNLPVGNLTGPVTSVGLATAIAANAITDTMVAALTATKLTGTIADARLSSNVPLLNAANVFTAAQSIAVNASVNSLAFTQAGAYALQVRLQRTGGTAADWYLFIPGGSSRFSLYGGAEILSCHTSGGVSIGNTTDPGAGALSLTATGGTFAIFDTTAANGGAIILRKSGTDFGYLASSKSLSGGLSATDVALWAANNLDVFSAGSMRFYTGAAEKMRLHTSGGVSIGSTTDPGGGNLSVTGTINVTGNASLTFAASTAPSNTVTPAFWIPINGGAYRIPGYA
jgi:hypothetical protein